MKKTLTRKQEESYQCIVRFTEEHGFPPTVRELGGITGSCFNINGIFQDQAVREKWIYPESSGISKSNRNPVMEVRHE